MVNSAGDTRVTITMNGEQLEEVTGFKYLGVTLTIDGTCHTEIRKRIATATSVSVRLTRVGKSKISFQVKFYVHTFPVIFPVLFCLT